MSAAPGTRRRRIRAARTGPPPHLDPSIPPHFYALPAPSLRDVPCARCGMDRLHPIHLEPRP